MSQVEKKRAQMACVILDNPFSKSAIPLSVQVVATGVALDMLHADSASGSAVLQLAKGDQVFLRLTGSDKTMVDSSSRFSTFSGYLIHAL